jgi:hypothetical protein
MFAREGGDKQLARDGAGVWLTLRDLRSATLRSAKLGLFSTSYFLHGWPYYCTRFR